MRYFVFIIVLLSAAFTCKGQVKPHNPNKAAMAYYREAQNKYVKYVTNKDSMFVVFKLLDKALKADPLYYDAWASKVAFQCQFDEYGPACKDIEKMVGLFPQDIYINVICGALQLKTGHRNEAALSFNKVLKLVDAAPAKNRKGDKYDETLSYRGVALIFLDKEREGKVLLKKLYINEANPVIKSRLAGYLNTTTKEALIEDVLPGRWN